MKNTRLLALSATAFVALALAAPVSASTITVINVGPSPDFLTSGGSFLPLDSLIRVGYIDNFGVNESAIRNGSIVDALAIIGSDFREIGSAVVTAGSGTGTIRINNAFGQEGKVSGSITEVNVGSTYVPGGEKLALVVYNADTAQDATEWGVFVSTGTGWDMPNDSLSDQTINTNEGVDALRGSIDGGDDLRLEVIPEPSIAVLLLGAMAGFVGLVRRR